MSLENDAAMKIGQKIDAALNMLNGVQPPAAMTSRIHRKLETAATASRQDRPDWLFWVPITCASMAAVLLVVLLQMHSTREKMASPIQTTKMAVLDTAPRRLITPQARLTPTENSRERKVSGHSVRQNLHPSKHDGYHHVANLADYPLTQQEKLLIEFVQTAKPADLQTLNPEHQADVEAQQNAEFSAYLKSGNSFNPQEATENHSTQE